MHQESNAIIRGAGFSGRTYHCCPPPTTAGAAAVDAATFFGGSSSEPPRARDGRRDEGLCAGGAGAGCLEQAEEAEPVHGVPVHAGRQAFRLLLGREERVHL